LGVRLLFKMLPVNLQRSFRNQAKFNVASSATTFSQPLRFIEDVAERVTSTFQPKLCIAAV